MLTLVFFQFSFLLQWELSNSKHIAMSGIMVSYPKACTYDIDYNGGKLDDL